MKIIFVHGTGVRQPAFAATFKTVQMNVAQFLPTASVVPCYWGDLGSNIGKGLSVPLYDQSKSIGQDEKEFDAPERWAFLYEDPLIELRLLATQDISEDSLGEASAPTIRGALTVLRKEIDAGVWPGVELSSSSSAVLAIEAIEAFDELDAAIDAGACLESSGAQGLDPVRLLVARAVTAGWIVEEMKADVPSIPATVRDKVLGQAFELLGGNSEQAKGLIGDFIAVLTKPLQALLQTIVIDPLWQGAAAGGRAYRHTIAQGATPGVGDILLYQARGERIRAFIAEAIDAASINGEEPVILLAHSLGGIACIDLLIATHQPSVKGVITVGSQAPFLYEIGALTQLEAPEELPSHMAPWLNIYDQDDMLSFKALPIMKGGNGISDSEIRSYQPFPAAHSAYWSNPPVWEQIKAFVESVRP